MKLMIAPSIISQWHYKAYAMDYISNNINVDGLEI